MQLYEEERWNEIDIECSKIMKIICSALYFINNNRTSLLLFYLCVTRWRSLISALSNQIWGQDRSMARCTTPIKPPWTCPTCLEKNSLFTTFHFWNKELIMQRINSSLTKAEVLKLFGWHQKNKQTTFFFTWFNLTDTYKWNKNS